MKSSRIAKAFSTFIFALLLAAAFINPAFASEGEGHGTVILGVPIIVWLSIANFTIFATVLIVLLRKPLMGFLKGRKEEVGNQIEEAKKLLAEAEALHEEVATRIARLESEIKTLRAEILKEGEDEGKRLIEKAEQASDRIKKEADFQANQEVKMAKLALQEEAARLAVELAEKLLEKNVNDSDRDRLLDEFISEVGK